LEPVDVPDQRDGTGVTISIALKVSPGRASDFEAYLEGITEAAEHFPGFVDVRAYRPRRSGRTYRIVLRFDSERSLRRWLDSDERRIWSDRSRELSEAAPRIANITGTAQEQPLALALTPFEEFVRTSVSGIGLLLVGTAAALIMANSRLSDSYEQFWESQLTIGTASHHITESLRHWVNDGLMALFFFTVGLEIKREVIVGELRYLRQAILPISAALGGAIVPALVYILFNLSGDGQHGWGIPIGTDTAFSLGILSLLGSRVSPQLLVFLTAFAIVDDILAVSVIAIFYTESINWTALAVAAVILGCLVMANRAGFQRWPAYAFLGIGVWLAIFESGIHGTLAGVLVAMTVPARSWINPRDFLRRARALLDLFERSGSTSANVHSSEEQQYATRRLERLAEEVETPMTHLEHGLSQWVSYGVLPLFAFANAGIPLTHGLGDAFASAVMWGVIAGLVVGKPLGITLFTWLAIRTRLALPIEGVSIRQVAGVAGLGGIGFTMSLFITELAFGEEPSAQFASIGVLLGSVFAGAVGYFVLRQTLPSPAPAQNA
jgi:NhaA family Na+:H+ antiporter